MTPHVNLIYMSMDECLLKPYGECILRNVPDDIFREDSFYRLKELAKDFNLIVVPTDHWFEHEITPPAATHFNLIRKLRKKFEEYNIITTSDNFILRGKYAPINDVRNNPCVRFVDPNGERFIWLAAQSHRIAPEMEKHVIRITSTHGLSKSAFSRAYDLLLSLNPEI